MTGFRFLLSYFLLFCIITCCSCNTKHSKQEIESAMQQYERLLQKMDADSISKMFTPSGWLGSIAHGRDSIKQFLLTFTNVKVLSASSTTDSIELKGLSATQNGMYYQTAVVDQKDTARLKGTYTVKWEWLPAEGWRIARITNNPTR